MHEMDISHGAVLEKGCVYIIPLLEGVDLRHRTSALVNPKSSTGRLDIFTRLITDGGTAFDQVREQYSGSSTPRSRRALSASWCARARASASCGFAAASRSRATAS